MKLLNYLIFAYKIVDIENYQLSRGKTYTIQYRLRYWVYPLGLLMVVAVGLYHAFKAFVSEFKNINMNQKHSFTMHEFEKPKPSKVYHRIMLE